MASVLSNIQDGIDGSPVLSTISKGLQDVGLPRLDNIPKTLGISGRHLGAPPFLTGDPRKEYYFIFLLTMPTLIYDIRNRTFVLREKLLNTISLLYISSLAEQVNLPTEKLEIDSVSIGTLQGYPVPKGFTTPTFSVVYLEDELESVYRFHTIWQNSIKGGGVLKEGGINNLLSSGAVASMGGGHQFEPWETVCCTAIYCPAKKMSFISGAPSVPGVSGTSTGAGVLGGFLRRANLHNLPGLNIPLGVDYFPYVFPTEIQRSTANKGGSGIAKTTVVYTRVPIIKDWNYVEEKDKVSFLITSIDDKTEGVGKMIEEGAKTEKYIEIIAQEQKDAELIAAKNAYKASMPPDYMINKYNQGGTPPEVQHKLRVQAWMETFPDGLKENS